MQRPTSIQTMVRRAALGLGLAGGLSLLAGCYTGVDEAPPAQPRSLVGVDVDGSLALPASGEFVLDADARALFDHFLAAEGEVDEAALHALVRAEIGARLHGAAADRAWEAFLAYVDYRREAAALLQQPGAGQDPEALISALAEIRARTIGDAPGVPDEGPRLRAALALQQTLSDEALPASERIGRVASLQAELGEAPDPRAPSRILLRVHAALAELPADDVEARRAVLVDLVGADAAERWLDLEARRRADDLTAPG